MCHLYWQGRAHKTVCPQQSCIATYISNHCGGNGFTGEDWLTWCGLEKIEIVSGREIANKNRILIFEDLLDAHTKGTLRSVLLPNGDIAVEPVSLHRRILLEKRRLFSSD